MVGGVKYCKDCCQTLPREMFCANKSSKDGLCAYCRECTKKRYSSYYKKNAESLKKRSADYRRNNHEQVKIKLKEWHQENKQHSLKYRQSAKQRINENGKRYRERHLGKVRARYAERRALLSAPVWACKEKMKGFYEDAVRLSNETGIPHEVDHIVPIKSKYVCGLHCEFNLQVVPREVNRRKSNLYWPDM